jgi:L-iditol 2-dehydrogenase
MIRRAQCGQRGRADGEPGRQDLPGCFPSQPVPIDVAFLVRNNIYLYGIRGEGKSATHRAEAFMRQKRFDATKIHTHTFTLADLPTALKYAKDRIEDAIKVVVKTPSGAVQRVAAE